MRDIDIANLRERCSVFFYFFPTLPGELLYNVLEIHFIIRNASSRAFLMLE